MMYFLEVSYFLHPEDPSGHGKSTGPLVYSKEGSSISTIVDVQKEPSYCTPFPFGEPGNKSLRENDLRVML